MVDGGSFFLMCEGKVLCMIISIVLLGGCDYVLMFEFNFEIELG